MGKHFFYRLIILFPIGRFDKRMRLKIALKPDLHHFLQIRISELPNLIKRSAHIDHIFQLDSIFIDWMIIMLCKKIFDPMRISKSTLFIKGNCQSTFSCTNL